MLTVAISLKRAMVVTALALVACAAPGPSGVAAAGAPSCSREEHVWTGTGQLGAGVLVVDTGMSVAAVAGEELLVVGVGSDGIDAAGQARALQVSVGGVLAAVGAVVPGGAIVVLGDGDDVLTVSGATVVLDRCTVVRSIADVPILPRTGGADVSGRSLVGMLAVGIGSAMVVTGRRRTAAR